MRPPESWRSAPATLVIAALTVLAWAVAAGLNMSDFAAVWGGFVPDRVTGLPGDEWLAPVWLTPLTATLVHAGFLHLALNMLILLFCARAVEPILGTVGLVILYVVGAYAAAAAHFFIHVQDGSPMVGASGAISAVLGAYAMLFGRNRVRIANPRLAVWVHALWLGAAWVVLQLLVGITFQTMGTRIAVAAHIGGFAAGLMLAKPLLLFRYRKA
ncbi:MAG: rhomboid family intramembrane serine protease [Sphingomonadales bacterium]